MRVLQINAVYQKLSTGRNMKEMHEFMSDKGIDSYVASPHLYGLLENCYQIGNSFDWKMHSLFSRITGLQGYFSYFSTKGLIRYIKKVKPDVIQLHNLHNNYINLNMLLKYTAKSSIPIAVTLHDTWFYTGKCCHYIDDNCEKWKAVCRNCPAVKKYNKSWFFDWSTKMQKDKKKWFSKNKVGVIGVSDWITKDSEKSTILSSSKCFKTIFNWIDLECFKPGKTDDLKKKLGLENKFIILGVSALWSEEKGLSVFLNLSKLLPENMQIVMIGNISDTIKSEFKDKIVFLPPTTNMDELAEFYSEADVFLNPSHRETFGKTTAEALASGTPVIGFNSTAAPEVIGTDGKCGYIVNENKAEKYLEGIKEIQRLGKAKFSDNCRNRAENEFNMEKNIEEYIKVYEMLTDK